MCDINGGKGMKINVKPSTDLAPVSVVMVSCGDMEASDIVTIAWTVR